MTGNALLTIKYIPVEPFRTVVEVPESKNKINHQSPAIWIGSCFTENIGANLRQLKFPTIINPFGVLYNPLSISNSLDILVEKRLFTGEELMYGNGLWFSFSHHSSFSHPDREACLEKINDNITEASAFLEKAEFLFITFGTARVYQLKETGFIVSNNHKLPHDRFRTILLSVDEIIDAYRVLFNKLATFNKKLQIVFTLSPVRHLKDGSTGNLISKSALILSIAKLTGEYNHVSYFPAYEIVMDDLRDYRFYDEDMMHINNQGIGYIWKKFAAAYIDSSSATLIKRISAINRGLEHRPFQPAGSGYRSFLSSLQKSISEIENEVPGIDFRPEKDQIASLLRQADK
jgi:hypothetical protein